MWNAWFGGKRKRAKGTYGTYPRTLSGIPIVLFLETRMGDEFSHFFLVEEMASDGILTQKRVLFVVKTNIN